MLERKEKRKRKLWVIIDPFVNKLHAFNLIANSASVASLPQDSPLLCSISSGKILVQFTIISYLRSQYQDDCEYSWFNHMFDRDSRANPEKAMAIHSGTLAWKIPRMEEPGRLQSMGSLRVEHDFTFTFTFHFHELEKEMATHSSVLAWRIPGTGEPGRLLSMATHRVWGDWNDLAAAASTRANHVDQQNIWCNEHKS